MKVFVVVALVFLVLAGMVSIVQAEIKWVNGYYRMDGTPVRGYYRDTSNDGNPYNNANYLGLN